VTQRGPRVRFEGWRPLKTRSASLCWSGRWHTISYNGLEKFSLQPSAVCGTVLSSNQLVTRRRERGVKAKPQIQSECLKRAAEARRFAREADDGAEKSDLFAVERRWRLLGESSEEEIES
jgi:hypothetical protein